MTRVATADVNGDGKLDLLIGDTGSTQLPAKGLSEDQCLEKLAQWKLEFEKISERRPKFETDDDWPAYEAWQNERQAHYRTRSQFLSNRSYGTVWLLQAK